jgi:SAM-dependent methyltransferase
MPDKSNTETHPKGYSFSGGNGMKQVERKSLEQSVVTAMDGTDPEIFPHLPYILQDVWEIGASPEVMVRLARRHAPADRELVVLDLGCGKGAVSVALARMLPCRCLGIDAVDAFVEEAREKSLAFGVAGRCTFETGDIREWVRRYQAGNVQRSKIPHGKMSNSKVLHGEVSHRDASHSNVPASPTVLKFDIIVLGSIGPVLGDYFETLTQLDPLLTRKGIVLIDDGYISGESTFSHPLIQRKEEVDRQIARAGMRLVDEEVIGADDMQASNKAIHQSLVRRCRELMKQYPKKRHLFACYIHKQEEEIDVLENRIICSTMVVGR